MNRKILALIAKFMLIRLKELDIPWRINLSITNLCNAKCRMCNVWKIYRTTPQFIKDEVSLEDLKKLFSELGRHLLWLHITGGEPFLRKDITKIVKVAVSECNNLAILDISTNGLLHEHIVKTAEHILRILNNKKVICGIGVSVDGPPEVHESIRGVSGAYNKALRTLMNLKELEMSYDNFFVHVNYTITRYNSGYIEKTYSLLQKEANLDLSDFSISIEHVGVQFKNLSDQSIYGDADKRKLILEDLKWLLDNMRMLELAKKRMLEKLRFKFKEDFVKLATQYVIDPTRRYFKCEAIRSSIFIDPYGDVYPCTIWNIRLGNIKEKSLKEILYSPLTLRTRKLIVNKKCPNCLSGCEIWPSLLLHRWSSILTVVI